MQPLRQEQLKSISLTYGGLHIPLNEILSVPTEPKRLNFKDLALIHLVASSRQVFIN